MIINILEKRNEALQSILKKKNALTIQVDHSKNLVIRFHEKAYIASRFGIICDKAIYIRNGDNCYLDKNCEIADSVVCIHGGRSFYAPLQDGSAEVCTKETALSPDFTFAMFAATEKTVVLILADGSLSVSPELAFFSTEKHDQRFALLSFFGFLKMIKPDCVAEVIKTLQGGVLEDGQK